MANRQHHGGGTHHQAELIYKAIRVLSSRSGPPEEFMPNAEFWSAIGLNYRTNGNKRNMRIYDDIERIAPGLVEVKQQDSKRAKRGWVIKGWRLNWSAVPDARTEADINRYFRERMEAS